MNDPATSIVILPALRRVEGIERSLPAVAGEPKDLYFPRHARLPNESGSRVLASLPCSCPTISDPPNSAVILSERSESKDLYLTQHAHTGNERDPLEGGGCDGSAETRATVSGKMK